jgi:large subunit ribosomal protein L5
MIPRLKEHYKKNIIDDLQKKFSMKNKLMVPKVIKVVLNMGLGADANDKKIVQNCVSDMSLIGGQMPIITKFKKSISNFKTRKGATAGVKVTLRSNKMYEFIDRLVNIALPRIKDFQGLSSKGFDKFGNYTFGIKEHIIFPEINFDKVDRIRGMDITVVTSSNNKDAAFALLEAMNFPFIKKNNKKESN